MNKKKSTPLVSIVITTKNESKHIANCLYSIQLQTYQNIEVIVVDNNSDDNTKAISKIFTSRIYDKGPERSAQRNYGMIEKANGKYVMYIDADMILSPDLIKSCVNYINKSDALALHVAELVLGRSYFSRVRNFERSFYDGTPIDGARFFCRQTFIEVGGFDEKLFREGSGEDWDIDKLIKSKGRIDLLDSITSSPSTKGWPMAKLVSQLGITHKHGYVGIYHNESEIKLSTYFKKKAYYSRGFDGYIQKWGADDPDICKQFGLYYRFLGVFVENGKWKKLLAKPHMTIGMYFLRFLVGLTFILRKRT